MKHSAYALLLAALMSATAAPSDLNGVWKGHLTFSNVKWPKTSKERLAAKQAYRSVEKCTLELELRPDGRYIVVATNPQGKRERGWEGLWTRERFGIRISDKDLQSGATVYSDIPLTKEPRLLKWTLPRKSPSYTATYVLRKIK